MDDLVKELDGMVFDSPPGQAVSRRGLHLHSSCLDVLQLALSVPLFKVQCLRLLWVGHWVGGGRALLPSSTGGCAP